MSPNLWFGAGAVPGVLQLGRAQLWFGCILYFNSFTLTLMSAISDEWVCNAGVIINLSCLDCPSWQAVHGKDEHQRALLAVAIVLAALGYICLALRWLPLFARFPLLKLLSMGLLAATIALDFKAYYSYRSSYEASVVSPSDGALFFCTSYSFAAQAAVYGCLTLGLLVWHEAVEWTVRRKMKARRQWRRWLRAQQEAESARQQPLAAQQSPAAEEHQPAATSPHPDTASSAPPLPSSPRASSPVPSSPPPLPSPRSQPSFQFSHDLHGIVVAGPSASSASFAAPAGRPTSSSSAVEWCEWLCLYTRPDAKLDSLTLKWIWKDQLSPMQRRLVLGINAFFLLLYCGGLIISSIESWAFQDGINYILSSWCTLGYGLYTPITTGGRIFMFVYWSAGHPPHHHRTPPATSSTPRSPQLPVSLL